MGEAAIRSEIVGANSASWRGLERAKGVAATGVIEGNEFLQERKKERKRSSEQEKRRKEVGPLIEAEVDDRQPVWTLILEILYKLNYITGTELSFSAKTPQSKGYPIIHT